MNRTSGPRPERLDTTHRPYYYITAITWCTSRLLMDARTADQQCRYLMLVGESLQ